MTDCEKVSRETKIGLYFIELYLIIEQILNVTQSEWALSNTMGGAL